MIMVLPNCED